MQLLLGIDFWRRFNLRIDFIHKTCEVSAVEPIEEDPTDTTLGDSILTGEQQKELEKLLAEYRPKLEPDHLGCARGVKHHINTGDAPPWR